MAAINITSLMTRLGSIGNFGYSLAEKQAQLSALLEDIWGLYELTPDLDLIGSQTQGALSTISAAVSPMSPLSGLGTPTLLRMVGDSVPPFRGSLSSCMTELIRQMDVASATVAACVVTASGVVLTTNTGDGVLVTTTKRGDGRQQDNMVAEQLRLLCTSDSYTGGTNAGSEQFQLAGTANTAGIWDYNWPLGSGQTVTTTAISASTDASSSGNLLTNGDMEDWSDDAIPELDNWQLSGGVWGTDIQQSATVYQGDFAVEFIAGTAATPILFQEFGEDTGVSPTVLNSYIVNFFARKVSGTISAGVLTIELTDDTGTVVNDEQGVANSTTLDLTTLTTTYAAVNVVFRIPQVPPTGNLRFRFRISTAIVGGNVLIDDACFGAVTAAYPGGFGFAVFSGATPFVKNDGWDVTTTNDRAGASYGATFQTLFDRLFGMRNLNQLLPTSATPTLPDSLITWPGILAYYRFQNDLVDSSGLGKDLTGSSDTYAAGKLGQCLASGSGSLGYPVPSIVDRSRSISVWLWAEPGINPGFGNVAARVGWQQFAVEYRGISGQDRIGWVVDGLTYSTSGQADAIISTWNHVVLTYDHTTNTGKLYVNGALGATETAAPSGQADFTLTVNTSEGGVLTSDVDEFLAFDGVLSAAQIAQLYNAGVGFDPTS